MSLISKMLEITNLNISLTAFPGTALHFPSQSLATPRLNPEPDFLPVVLLLWPEVWQTIKDSISTMADSPVCYLWPQWVNLIVISMRTILRMVGQRSLLVYDTNTLLQSFKTNKIYCDFELDLHILNIRDFCLTGLDENHVDLLSGGITFSTAVCKVKNIYPSTGEIKVKHY